MTYKKIIVAACLMALSTSTMMFTSCKKNKLTDAEISAVQDGATADGTSQETQNLAEQAKMLGSGNMRMAADYCSMLSGCATITNDTINNGSNPDTLTIDFGSNPCMCRDIRFRSGKIVISYTGHYHDAGAVIDMHFVNYSVGPSTSDMYTVDNSSTKHIVNNGLYNGTTFFSWSITSNMSITKSGGAGTITFTESKTRVQFAGDPNHYNTANKFYISGSANGTAANGTGYTAATASGKDLVRDMSCRKHFTQGELDITPSGKSMIAIDFGSGTCDNTATITRNGVTRTITLR